VLIITGGNRRGEIQARYTTFREMTTDHIKEKSEATAETLCMLNTNGSHKTDNVRRNTDLNQGRNVRVNRVSPANTLKN
jgi:hypothetical protein